MGSYVFEYCVMLHIKKLSVSLDDVLAYSPNVHLPGSDMDTDMDVQ